MMENIDQDLQSEALPNDPASAGVPPFRAERYWHYLDAMDLTEPQKAAILETLWGMMVGFVDLGFGVDPVQQILPMILHASIEEAFSDAVHNDNEEALK